MELVSGEEGRTEQFPVGMRILAVDDNPASLDNLETLLLICKYHVTKTTEPKKALEMLRDKSNMFDLVITAVEITDTDDGLKLLEICPKMALPVIMVSDHFGRRHGVCDYLIKPVDLKQLQNIWHHVARKKKINSFAKNIGPSHQLPPPSESHLIEEKDGESNEQNGKESCTPKKPRVVWSPELHQKFLTAVEQLGIDKAIPKKIYDLMNVEGLTRVDVASHLQKYRLRLKNRQYLLNLAATEQLPSSALLSQSHLTNLHPSMNSSSLIQEASNSAYPAGTDHQTLLPTVKNVNVFQPLEPLQVPSNKCSACTGDLKSMRDRAVGGYQKKDQRDIAINISEVTKTGFPMKIEPYYGGATWRHRFFFPLLLAAAIALSTFSWFFC